MWSENVLNMYHICALRLSLLCSKFHLLCFFRLYYASTFICRKLLDWCDCTRFIHIIYTWTLHACMQFESFGYMHPRLNYHLLYWSIREVVVDNSGIAAVDKVRSRHAISLSTLPVLSTISVFIHFTFRFFIHHDIILTDCLSLLSWIIYLAKQQ